MAIATISYEDKIYPHFQKEKRSGRFQHQFQSITIYRMNGMQCIFLISWLILFFSSHCLEHISEWVKVLDYWTTRIKSGGVLFLYLPDYSQVYWRPWNNRKHVNILSPEMIKDYMINSGYYKVFASGVDLYNSFMVMGEKI